ncbi:MAG: hypothetical protein FWC98_05540 [Bacteroidales bacterium]|nr:hypothetical protein [Bacteroidales bacterium]
MTTISSKTFLENPSHFFNLARREELAVKRGNSLYRIVFTAPSESISPAKEKELFFAGSKKSMSKHFEKYL